MDLLRNCTSGVHIIKCFKKIHFIVLKPDPDALKASDAQSQFRYLQDLENALRQLTPLISIDHQKSEVWMFSGEPPAGETFPTIPKTVCGLAHILGEVPRHGLKVLKQGQAEPLDFLNVEIRNDSEKFKPFVSTHIFDQFIGAALNAISHHLVLQGLLPVNSRTFATRRHNTHHVISLPRVSLLNIDVQLVSIGHLRVFTHWEHSQDVSCCADILSDSNLLYCYDNPMVSRLAPSGELALAWLPPAPSKDFSAGSIKQQLPTPSFSVAQRISWRKMVSSYLQAKNITATSVSDDRQWTTIVIPCPMEQYGNSDLAQLIRRETLCVEWPSRLCLIQNSDLSPEWSAMSDSLPDILNFDDPLQSAIDWMENKSQRDSEFEARRTRSLAQKDEVTTHDATPYPFDSLSPKESRNMTTSESQNIYPTPSDGLPAQVTPGPTLVDVHLVTSSKPPDASQGSIDGMDIDDKPIASNPSEVGRPMRQASFGEDDRYFGTTALTDIDFDFFNQPVDMDMDTDLSLQDASLPDIGQSSMPTLLSPLQRTGQSTIRFEDPQSELPSLASKNDIPNPALNVSDSEKASESSADSGAEPLNSNNNAMPVATEQVLPVSNRLQVDQDKIRLLDDTKYAGGGRYNFPPRNLKGNTGTNLRGAKARPQDKFSTSLSRLRNQRYQWNRSSSDDDDSDTSESNSKSFLADQSEVGDSKSLGTIEGLTSSKGKHDLDKIMLGAAVHHLLERFIENELPACSLAPSLRLPVSKPDLEGEAFLVELEEQMQVFQLIAEQICFGLLDLSKPNSGRKNSEASHDLLNAQVEGTDQLNQAFEELFPNALHEELDLSKYLLQSTQKSGPEKDGPVSSIPPAHISLLKADTSWAFTSTAVSFWETLGLEPANGVKDASAFVMYPWSQTLEDGVTAFLQTVENSWLGHKLGTHKPGYLQEDIPKGHFPIYQTNSGENGEGEPFSIKVLLESCRKLGTRLFSTLSPNETAVIYIVNSFTRNDVLPRLCECFITLLNQYKSMGRSENQSSCENIVLQVLPITLVASPNAPVFLDSDLSATISHKVYDKCRIKQLPASKPNLAIASGASVILAKPVPKAIRFQLSIHPSSHVLEEGSRIHLAYYESVCGSWISAAWTDDTGEHQHTANYRQSGNTSVKVIIKEIWETTLEIIKAVNVHWRIIIAKVGVLKPNEMETWHNLAAKQTSVSHALCLVSVDPSPWLTVGIKPSVKAVLNEGSASVANSYSTPGSTPHPQISSPAPVSPSHLPSVSTPSNFLPSDQLGFGDIDPSVQLIDKTDESWAFVLPQRLNVTNTIPDFNPALASGYLVKRTGVDDRDCPVLIEVNLMHLQEVGKVSGTHQASDDLQIEKGRRYDRILMEILVMYRNLGLLARLRRLEHSGSCMPWHVAVVFKAAEGLSKHVDDYGTRNPQEDTTSK